METSESNAPSPKSCRSPSAATWFSSIVHGRSSASMQPNNSSAADGGGFSGPVNNKHQFHGVMFKYGPKPIQLKLNRSSDVSAHIKLVSSTSDVVVAFKTGHYKQQLVFIGGLKEGILAAEYLEPLAIALEKEHWSLVQFQLSSSYSGYGISSLKQDAMELDQLISYLIDKEDSHGVILLGHSTGCQDIVYYLRSNAACTRAVRAAILQAPVSDREYMATQPETASMIELASKMMKEGRDSELMPRKADPDSPITAYRYYSLFGYNGDDDMFSSDFSDDELKQKLGHMSNTPTVLVIFSMDDEYVPKHIDKRTLVSRFCKAMGGAEKAEIEHGTHSLSNRTEEAVKAIMEIVKRDGPKGCEDPWC